MKASATTTNGTRMSTSIQFRKKQRQYIIHEDDDLFIYNLNENENKNKNKNTNNLHIERDKFTYTNRSNTLTNTNTNTNTAPKPKTQNFTQEYTERQNRKNRGNKLGRITRREQKQKKQASSKQRSRNKHLEDTDHIEHGASWGDQCIKINDNDTETLRIYCQNVNGIYDEDGLGLDEAFHLMRTAKANIFTFNETHGDDMKPRARSVLYNAKNKIWKQQDGHCSIVTSSSGAQVAKFTKPGGNLVGVSGAM